MPVTEAAVLDHTMGSLLRLNLLYVVLASLLLPGRSSKCSSPSHCRVAQEEVRGWVVGRPGWLVHWPSHPLASTGIVRASCDYSCRAHKVTSERAWRREKGGKTETEGSSGKERRVGRDKEKEINRGDKATPGMEETGARAPKLGKLHWARD